MCLELLFPPFRLDLVDERLWRDAQPISLRPKTFAVLRCLVEAPGQLVTKETLLDATWPDLAVSDVVLKVCVRELRQALQDDARRPRFIETVYRRGYRFIASVTEVSRSAAQPDLSPPTTAPLPLGSAGDARPESAHIVGRETEMGYLYRCLERAQSGTRQVVFVSGEAGLGKTTVLDMFMTEVRPSAALRTARGQCIEHYGSGEAYMPVLEVLEQLCQAPDGDDVIDVLGPQAPSWLVQIPWLLNTADLERLQRATLGVTRERMLREMARAIQALSSEKSLVLVFEDLHWSDYATLDLLTVLARRQEPAKLLVVGSYRPEEVMGQSHPLRTMKQELLIHGYCQELPLSLLSQAAVATYLSARLPGTQPIADLARFIHRRTDGNPLFMVNIVDSALSQNVLGAPGGPHSLEETLTGRALGIPESLQQMLEQRLDRLSLEEQRVLEVGSVVGAEFAAAAVASGLEVEAEQVEAWCEGLVRRGQWLQPREQSAWSDGTVSGRYGFIHAFYQEVAYSRVSAARRLRLHRQIGTRLEDGYGERAQALAAELAMHFERGQECQRAVWYRGQAAENALRRSAYVETMAHLTRGLELLQSLPETSERTLQELRLLIKLGSALTVTKGWSASEAGNVYARARELCSQVGDTPERLPVLFGLGAFYMVQAEYHTARELAEEFLGESQRHDDPMSCVAAHRQLGAILSFLGELRGARTHLERSLALAESQQQHAAAVQYSQDPRVAGLSFLASTLWLLGYPEQALESSNESISLAHKLSHPFSVAYSLVHATRLHQLRREVSIVQEQTSASLTLASEHDATILLTRGTIQQGWVLAMQGQTEEGIAQMRQGLSAMRAVGDEARRPYFLARLAEAYGVAGQADQGLAVLAEAQDLIDHTAECVFEAEIWRLRGILLLDTDDGAQFTPEDCFQKSLDIARCQHAKSLELRAATSLARLWQQQGKRQEASDLLAPVYGWFTEGFDTADLQEASALLGELA